MRRLAGFPSQQKRLYIYKDQPAGVGCERAASLAKLGQRSHKRAEAFKSFLAKMEAKRNVR